MNYDVLRRCQECFVICLKVTACAAPCPVRSGDKGNKFRGYPFRISVTLPVTFTNFLSFCQCLGQISRLKYFSTTSIYQELHIGHCKTCEGEEVSLSDLLIYDTPNKCPDGTLKEAAVASLQVLTLVLYIQRCKRFQLKLSC